MQYRKYPTVKMRQYTTIKMHQFIDLCPSLDSTGEYTTHKYFPCLKCVRTEIIPAKYQFNTKYQEKIIFQTEDDVPVGKL